jgi:23S rRNA pseudouridine955/2504/2580 synthase
MIEDGFGYLVSQDDDGCRVDRFVRNLFKDAGYVLLQKLFRQGKIKVNGKKAKANQRLNENDRVVIYSNQLTKNSDDSEKIVQKDPRLEKLYREMLIFENDDFLALNKKQGLAVQLGSKLNFCVETILRNVLERYFLVHRLDKDTSGVLLVAKTQKYARKLTQLFRDGKIKKTYWAIVDGKINKSGVIRNFIGKSFVSGEERMTVTDEKNGKSAVTRYAPVNRVGYFTLMKLNPETGRKHQLRVHCAEILKAPILGDTKYNKNVQHKNLFLHAKLLVIPDLNFKAEAPLPQHFLNINKD